jgi:hypothetical protein
LCKKIDNRAVEVLREMKNLREVYTVGTLITP